MAIRKPSINAPGWLYQDFPYSTDGVEESRYVQVKYDGETFTRVSQTYDYSDPPFLGYAQKGGPIVAQLNYTKVGQLITIDDWEVNWRDEWPLRLAVNYLSQCLYPTSKGFVVRVKSNEAYPFWVSEQFVPLTNTPEDYMVLTPSGSGTAPSPVSQDYSVSISPNPVEPGEVIYVLIETKGVPLGTPLYWEMTGPGANPNFFPTGETSGKVEYGAMDKNVLKIPLEQDIPGPGPYPITVIISTDPEFKEEVGSASTELVIPFEPF